MRLNLSRRFRQLPVKFRHLCLVFGLACFWFLLAFESGDAVGSGNERVFPDTVPVRQDFASAQQEQARNPESEIETAPGSRAFGRIPARQPSHNIFPSG